MQPTLPVSVKALLVEEDLATRELIQAALVGGGLQAHLDSVGSLAEARRRLDAGTYDVVLAAYQMAGSTGFDVLHELRARRSDVPVVILAGAIGEEKAVECLRAGAADCVFKHHLSRLPIAVESARAAAKASAAHSAALEELRRLSLAVDQSPATVVITDTKGTIQYVNERFTEITGYTREEALGANPRILKSGRTPPEVYDELWQTLLSGRAWRGDILNRRKNGELYWARASISPISGPDGVTTHFVSVEEDISESRWAQEAIREREELLSQITDSIKEVFFIVDADFRETLFISPAYELVWGRSCRSAYEMPSSFMDAVHPEDRSTLIASITRTRAGEDAGAVEFRVVQPSGQERWVTSHASAVLDETGKVYRIAGVALDITERHHVEERLRESEERFRRLTDASFDAVVVAVQGVVLEANPGFGSLIGYDLADVVGHSVFDFIVEASREEAQRRISQNIEGTYEVVLRHSDGRMIQCEATGRTLDVDGRRGRITALRDVTKQRALEAQFRQAQKLEAVGRLAGGIAHDFNNVLTVILTEVQLLRQNPTPDGVSLAVALEEIESAAKRAAGLTRQLLAFSRRDVVQPEVLEPAEVVQGLNKMLLRLIGEDVMLTVSLTPDAGRVRIDRGHLEQVIVNLVVNARDAMPQGGKLHLEVAPTILDDGYAEAHPGCEPGPHVMVAVSDTGCGMSKEVQARLFEPFFTTKPVGRGTGLGMATSYGIVKECGGYIGVYSEVDIGTTVKVYLPVVVSDAPGPSAPDRPAQAATRLSATILVVEDEPTVRRATVRLMKHLGCEVLVASEAAEALAVLTRKDQRIDVLFTDIVLPGMSGPELAARARDLRPDIKVLFTTGYTGDMIVRHQLAANSEEVLSKPYSSAELASKLAALL